ncbi:MAG: toll/interleukin-1 receptor domain-containing protein [Rubrivivax sp.]|nr:toll/interleukin-1 receptor domain-containing protein [Rubrivivax sp.]
MPQKQVFISHISAETEIARRLKQRLDGDFLGMLQIFVSSDRETIRAGQKWLDEVDRALRAADAELILCSRESVGRPWVNFEAGAAWLRRIPVIPVCHSGLALTELPVPLNLLQGVECASAEGLQKLYDALAAVLGVKTPAVDFQALAADLRQLQAVPPGAASAIERIEEPRILCAASP